MMCLFQGLANGYVTFVISILFIGACTAVIGDIAGHLGCFINLKDGVNAIAFVALGTSVPGSKKAPILVQKLCWLFFMMSLKVWFLLVSSSTILMFVTLFFLFPSSTNKHMTDVDVTPPSPNACSYLPALLNGSPTFVTLNISKIGGKVKKLSGIKPPLYTKNEWLFLGMKVKVKTIQLASV